MSILSILFIAFGLAMDAFAVSVTSGFTVKRLGMPGALRLATSFGLFQAAMPVVGWLAGLSVRDLIASVDHWVAFGLLALVGVKMIYESMKMPRGDGKDVLTPGVLFLLSLATSIDALAVGLTLSLLDVAILMPVLVIGLVTFGLSLIGVYIGKQFGHFFEKGIEVTGGLILIGIGTKILAEHLT